MSITGPVEMAQICWGNDLPPWIMDLAIECARTSQNKVAAKMEYSSALISQLVDLHPEVTRVFHRELTRLKVMFCGLCLGQDMRSLLFRFGYC